MMKPLSPDSSKALLVSEKCAFPWRGVIGPRRLIFLANIITLFYYTGVRVRVCVCT